MKLIINALRTLKIFLTMYLNYIFNLRDCVYPCFKIFIFFYLCVKESMSESDIGSLGVTGICESSDVGVGL